MIDFLCNICGAQNRCDPVALTREAVSCITCRSNVRERGLVHALSMELFGLPMTLPEFPHVKSLRGLGTSDSNLYAARVAEKLDYRNTFYDREPRFDLACPPPQDLGGYDFLLSSDVLEHVAPPVEAALANACRILKPDGVLIFTVPYSIEAARSEHYPDLHQFGFAEVGGKLVLVNRTPSGEMQVFEDPVFHRSAAGDSLEMREFS